MTEYQETIAKIESTWLGYEDHGIFSFNVTFTYGTSSQGTGHYALCESNEDLAGPKDAVGVYLLKAIINSCGVRCWEDLVGRTVIVLRDPERAGLIAGIKPLPTEKGKQVIFKDVFDRVGIPA